MCEAEAVAHDLPQNLAQDLCQCYWSIEGQITVEQTINISYTLADKYEITPKQVVDLFSEIAKIFFKYGELLLQEIKEPW